MIRKLLSRSSSVQEATVILAVASLVSRLFGLLRDRTLASHFGASEVLDAYFAAFRIPDLVFNLLILGALSSAFIPLFLASLKKDREEAWALVNILINVGVAFLAAVLLLLFIFAPALSSFIAPGFEPARKELVTVLMRVMLLSPLIFGLSNLAGGILNAYRNFLVYALAPILYNLGIIFGVLYLVPPFGPVGLAYGVVLGALLHLFIQLPSVFLLGYRYRFRFEVKHPFLRQMAALMLPRTLALATNQLMVFANTIIASTLAVGSIAVLNLVDNIYSLPVSLFGISLAVALFPLLSDLALEKKKRDFAQVVNQGLRQMAFLILPAMLFYWLFRAQIIRLVLGAGLFGWEETRFAISVLAFMTFGMIAASALPILARAFYAYKDTLTPFGAGIAALVVDLLAAFILIPYLKVVGLALAISVAVLFNASLLAVYLQQRTPWFRLGEWLNFLFAALISGFVAAAGGYLSLRVMDLVVDTHTVLGLLSQTALAGLIFLFLYLALMALFKVPESNFIRQPLRVIKQLLKL